MTDSTIHPERIILPVDGEPDLAFTGTLLAKVLDNDEPDDEYWTILALYITTKGQYVVHRTDDSRRSNYPAIHLAKVCSTPQEVIEFLGQDPLPKRLYEAASIPNIREIE